LASTPSLTGEQLNRSDYYLHVLQHKLQFLWEGFPLEARRAL